MYKTINVDFISSKFYEHADENLHTIKKSLIYHIIDQYWKNRRIESKYYCFNRKFWENPDYNDTDLYCAFRRKSEKEKIKTRPKLELNKKKLREGEKAFDQTVKFVLQDLLPNVFQREAQK